MMELIQLFIFMQNKSKSTQTWASIKIDLKAIIIFRLETAKGLTK